MNPEFLLHELSAKGTGLGSQHSDLETISGREARRVRPQQEPPSTDLIPGVPHLPWPYRNHQPQQAGTLPWNWGLVACYNDHVLDKLSKINIALQRISPVFLPFRRGYGKVSSYVRGPIVFCGAAPL